MPLVLFLWISLLASAALGQDSFLSEECSSEEVLDTGTLTCEVCAGADERVPHTTVLGPLGDAMMCRCDTGYAESLPSCDVGEVGVCPAPTCTDCVAQGQVSDRAGSRCLNCPANTTLDTEIRECICPSNHVLIDVNAVGEELDTKQCVECPPRTRAFFTDTGEFEGSRYECRRCPDELMEMDTEGECSCDSGWVLVGVSRIGPRACIREDVEEELADRGFTTSSASSVTFRDVERPGGGDSSGTIDNVASLTFRHYAVQSAARCWMYRDTRDLPACHALANLCVLQLYDLDTTVCSLFRTLSSTRAQTVHGWSSWPRALPFLIYGDRSAAVGSTVLDQTMTFRGGGAADAEDTLRFFLAAYALNGTFLGLERLTWQLQYCSRVPQGSDEPPRWVRFGHFFRESFTCDLSVLLREQHRRQAEQGGSEPVFYDLYYVDSEAGPRGADRSRPVQLFPAAVRVTNLRQNGQRPNENAGVDDEGDDVYVRRFFLFEGVTGLTSGGGSNPVAVRYAAQLILTIPVRSDDRSLLLPPTLTVRYKTRRTNDLQDSFDKPSVEFEVQYRVDLDSFWTAALVLFVMAQTMAFGAAVLRMNNWGKRSARRDEEYGSVLSRVARFIVYLAHTFAQASFWIILIMTMYWLIIFKLQDRVFMVLPEDRDDFDGNPYSTLITLLWLTAVAQAIRVAEVVAFQSWVDVFFIDWEKPRGPTARTGGDFEAGMREAPSTTGAGGGSEGARQKYPPVSVWRTLYMANEWTELQTHRRVNPYFTFSLMAVLLQAADLQFVATPQPDVNDLSPDETNPALQFANSFFWFAILIIGQYLFMVGLAERYLWQSPSTRFIDLCTVAKVSVLFLDEKYHGYYMHCDAPYEFADGDMRQVILQLLDEQGNVRTSRGMQGSPDPDCQTFEMFFPDLWRRKFDQHYLRLRDKEAALRAPAQAQRGRPQPGGPRAPPKEASYRELVSVRHEAALHITRFLKGFIVADRVGGIRRVFRTKTFWQRFLNIPPDMDAENTPAGAGAPADEEGTAVVFMDTDNRFEKLLFHGVEWDLLLLEFLVRITATTE